MKNSRIAIRTIAFGLGLTFLVGCGGTYMPPLTARGVPAEERRDYIIQNGFGLPEHVKQAFLDGYIVEGMTKEMVFHLFGEADRKAEQDSHWEYVNRKGALVVGVRFKKDKIEKIEGDPTGGADKSKLEDESALPGP